MIHRINHRTGRTSILALTALLVLWGCSKTTDQPPVATQPETIDDIKPFVPQTQTTTKPATQPATQPETQPAVDPPCTYDPDPPYTVNLFVRRPEQEQPGWLRITGLLDPDTPSTATGEFPRQNHVYVQTSNVHLLEIDIEFLPLGPRNSVILHIDKQVIEIFRRADRPKLAMERRPTGAWMLVRRSE